MALKQDTNGNRTVFTTSKEVTVAGSFEEMNLKEDLLRGIYSYGYELPSAVQSRAITQILKGRGNTYRVLPISRIFWGEK